MASNFPKLIKDSFGKLYEPHKGVTRDKSSLPAMLIQTFKNSMLSAYSDQAPRIHHWMDSVSTLHRACSLTRKTNIKDSHIQLLISCVEWRRMKNQS